MVSLDDASTPEKYQKLNSLEKYQWHLLYAQHCLRRSQHLKKKVNQNLTKIWPNIISKKPNKSNQKKL